jgi:hypothetical protein
MTTIEQNHYLSLPKKHLMMARVLWAVVLLFSTMNILNYFVITKSALNLSDVGIGFTDTFVLYLYGVALTFVGIVVYIPKLAMRGVSAKPELAYSRRILGLALRLSFLTAIAIFGLTISIKTQNGNAGLPMAVIFMTGMIASFPMRTFSDFSKEELSRHVEILMASYPPLPKINKVGSILIILVGVVSLRIILIVMGYLLMNNKFCYGYPKRYKVVSALAGLLSVYSIYMSLSYF